MSSQGLPRELTSRLVRWRHTGGGQGGGALGMSPRVRRGTQEVCLKGGRKRTVCVKRIHSLDLHTLCLVQRFSKSGARNSSISMSWELVRNGDSAAPPQTC